MSERPEVEIAAFSMLAISAVIMSPEQHAREINSLILCSSFYTHEYMELHNISIADVKQTINRPSLNHIIDLVYESISNDMDEIKSKILRHNK